jgi:hypothetical protein
MFVLLSVCDAKKHTRITLRKVGVLMLYLCSGWALMDYFTSLLGSQKIFKGIDEGKVKARK